MTIEYSRYGQLPFILLSAALIAAALLPIASVTGIPSFEQDWQWPIARAQCGPYMLLGMQPWNSSGIGQAQIYPEAWAPYVIGGSLCSIASPHVGLILYLILLLALAAIGVRWLAKTLGFDELPSLTAAALYLGSPVLLNELHAGHLHFIFSYAMLPIFLAAICDPSTANRPIVLGALLGLASAQQQFFFFGAVLGTLAGLRYRASWFTRTALPALMVSLVFTAPQWIVAASHAASSESFGVFQPLMHWEASQSVPFSQAIRSFGYIGGYDGALPQWLRSLVWLLPACAFMGACVALINRKERVWIVAAGCALLVIIGLNGPIGTILASLMERSAIFAVFRELYTFEAIVALCYAVLIALFINSVTSSGRFRWAVSTLGALLIIMSGAVAFFDARNMPAFSPSPVGAAMIDRIAIARGFGRYLAVPAALPQAVSGWRVTGLSPFTLPIGTHPSALDTLYETPYSSLVATQDYGSLPATLLRALGVSHVLNVPGVLQANNYEPQLRHIFPSIPSGKRTRWGLLERQAERVALVRSSTRVEVIQGSEIDLNSLAQGVNPRYGWARTALWNNLPAWIYARVPGIFTLQPAIRLNFLGPTTVIAGSALGTLRTSGCLPARRLDASYFMLHCTGIVTIRAIPPIVISEAVSGTITFVRPAGGGTVNVVQDSLWHLVLHVDAPARSVLELRERMDRGWQCLGCNAIAARADGYANAWILPTALNGRVTIEFTPARFYYLALFISIVALIAAIIEVTRFLWQSRTASPRRVVAVAPDRSTTR